MSVVIFNSSEGGIQTVVTIGQGTTAIYKPDNTVVDDCVWLVNNGNSVPIEKLPKNQEAHNLPNGTVCLKFPNRTGVMVLVKALLSISFSGNKETEDFLKDFSLDKWTEMEAEITKRTGIPADVRNGDTADKLRWVGVDTGTIDYPLEVVEIPLWVSAALTIRELNWDDFMKVADKNGCKIFNITGPKSIMPKGSQWYYKGKDGHVYKWIGPDPLGTGNK